RRPPTSPLFPYTTLFRSQVTTASLPHYPLGVSLALARQLGADSVELALTPALLRQGAEHARQLSEARGVPVRILSLAPLGRAARSEEHTSELQSRFDLVC